MTADEILEQMANNPELYAADPEGICVIDNDLRTISIPSSVQLAGVESDEDVRRLYFQMPKQYGEVDLSEFDIRINFMNANNQGDVYAVTDKQVSGDNITFSWLVGRNALAYRGSIRFIVCLKKTDAEGVVQQEFNTTIAQLTVLEGLETTEAVVAENPDIINQLLAEMESVQEIATPTAMQNYVNAYLEENPVQGGMTDEQEQQLEQNTKEILNKLDKNQGIENAGKALVVGEDGSVVLGEVKDSPYFEVIGARSGAFHPEALPTTYAENENWLYSTYGTEIYHGVGNIGCVYKNALFTGTIYIRGLNHTQYSDFGSMDIYASDTDVLPKDWTRETGTVEKLTDESFVKQFSLDDNTGYVFIKSDGSYVVGSDDGEPASDSNGWIYLRKYTIPEGKYGWLISPIAGNIQSQAAWNQYGYPAVFDIDPSDNIVQSVSESASLGQLQTKSEYTQGFMKFLAGNSSFQSYIAEYIDNFIPLTSKRQTFGKAIYIGGDSLHAYAGGDGFAAPGFVTNWNRYLGFSMVTNAGYAGSKWSETTGGGGIKRAKDLISAGIVYDVIILAWGTNDDTGGNGTIDDPASDSEGCTMIAAMKWVITNLRNTFKSTTIGVIIPPPKHAEDGMEVRGNLMVQVCELLHVPYVDMREYISISDLGSDHIHLGTGAGKYGAAEASLILRICQYGDTLYPGNSEST